MNWLRDLITKNGANFREELDLLVARWTDVSRKGREALTVEQVATTLHNKAEQIVSSRIIRGKPRRPVGEDEL